ncbi:MAG: hypothetical protein P4L51_11040, partial [Puia sp.]|nr:hypothetical protein [Puia sp.]
PASDALFAVNGNAYVKKLFVTLTGWPDYVFHKEYKLPGLPEVERYIAMHQHLPGVTPADEVVKKGLDLGASQSELLKKIEELTLYLIEQNKKIKLQEDKIDQLVSVNEKLEKQQAEIDALKELVKKLAR